jgi:hypothetical protein
LAGKSQLIVGFPLRDTVTDTIVADIDVVERRRRMVSTWMRWVIEFSEIPITGKVEYRHVGFSQKLDL